MDSILTSTLGDCQLRQLSHTKPLSHAPALVFKAISDISSYSKVLPLTISSSVTARDKAGYASCAKIRIGSETLGLDHHWDSTIHCDPQKLAVDARSTELHSGSKNPAELAGSTGMIDVLRTKWHISPVPTAPKQAKVKLDLEVRFRSPVVDQMFAQIQEVVGEKMISAFEQRVRELEEEERKRALVSAKKTPRKLEIRNPKTLAEMKGKKKTGGA